jgi:hypothetical protein
MRVFHLGTVAGRLGSMIKNVFEAVMTAMKGAAAMALSFVVVDSVGLGDRRGHDECKELLESEQWLAL